MTYRVTLLMLLVASSSINAQRLVRIFVAPVETVDGFKTPDHQRRADSRIDVIKNLSGDKTLALVEARGQADLVLEILSSDRAKTGALRTETSPDILVPGKRSGTTTETTAPTVIVKLTAGTFEHEIRGQYASSIRWRDAANNASSQIKKWIKENRERLVKTP